jgi:ribosomal 50S subunit-recycling heat shock protein
MRFDLLLSGLHLYKSRAQAQAAIEEGRALLNGATAKPSHTTKAGDRITLVLAQGERTIEIVELPRL